MSTLLVDTEGGSQFKTEGSIGGEIGAQILKKIPGVSNLNLSLTDEVDAKPVLKPTKGVIDVVNDFSWYAGPKMTPAALNKVPCAFIQEREQLMSSLVSGAAYYLNATTRVAQSIGKDVGKLLSTLGVSTIDTSERLSYSNAADQAILKANNLTSLEGLYFTRETGFNYRFPLYDQPSGISNSWGSEGGGMLRDAVNKVQGFADSIAEVANLGQPGVFIEKPKYFSNATEGRVEKLSFPLSNTVRRGAHSPIQQNAELLWLLAFQNKPYKTSFARTLPPKLYNVSVPGRFSMPYAYISNMTVNFNGTVRNRKVNVPSGNGEGKIGSASINTPVPEAYSVVLEFTELIGSYGNTMLGTAFSTSIENNKVKFGREE